MDVAAARWAAASSTVTTRASHQGLHGLYRVLGYGDGADNFAAVGMDSIDKPGLAKGIVDNGNLLLDGCLNIFLLPLAR